LRRIGPAPPAREAPVAGRKGGVVRKHLVVSSVVVLALAAVVMGTAVASGGGGDKLVRQPSPKAVVAEHLDALNSCDLERLLAQYPNKAELHLSDGNVVKGRDALRELFAGFVAPYEEGGLCGLTFTTESSFKVDGTLNVQWRAEAPFLAETYRGSDAYVTKNGLMYAQVTTFEGTDLKFKP
jgi:SnoaL-like domain